MATGNWLSVIEGDEVAILPRSDSPAAAVLDIQTVSATGLVYIELRDTQIYKRIGGESLDGLTIIVPATEQHRATLKAKRK
jgi:hypothetical protein